MKDISFTPENEIDVQIKTLTEYFTSNQASINAKSEASFITKYIMPFFHEIFLKKANEDTVYAL